MYGWPFIGYVRDVLNTTIVSIATMTMLIAIFVNTITMLIVTDFSVHIHIVTVRAHSFSHQFLLAFIYVIYLLDCKNLSPSLSCLSLCWFLILVFVNPITNTIHALVVKAQVYVMSKYIFGKALNIYIRINVMMVRVSVIWMINLLLF